MSIFKNLRGKYWRDGYYDGYEDGDGDGTNMYNGGS